MEVNPYIPSTDDIISITSIFPDIERSNIVRDLQLTQNTQSTINRILDGTFCHIGSSLQSHPENPELAARDDDDLPLTPFHISSNPEKSQKSMSSSSVSMLRKFPSCSVKSTHKKYLDCLSDDDDDVEVIETDLKSSTTSSMKLPRPKYTDSFSDDSDSDLELKETKFKPSSKQSLIQSKPVLLPTISKSAIHTLSDSDSGDEVDRQMKSLTERIYVHKVAKTHDVSESESDTESIKSHVMNNEKDWIDKTEECIKPTCSKKDEFVLSSLTNTISNALINQQKTGTTEMTKIRKSQMSKRPREPTEKQRELQDKKRLKEEEKQRKKQEQEEKRRLKEYEKTKQRTLREAQKSAKPGEATKTLTVMIDPLVLQSTAATPLLEILQKHEITYEITNQVLPGVITFWREVTEVIETAPLQLETTKKEVVQDDVLLVLSCTDFAQLVNNFKQKQQGVSVDGMTLREYVTKVKKSLEERKVTLIVQDIEKYFREQRTNNQQKFRNEMGSTVRNKNKSRAPGAVKVSRLDMEEAHVDLQMYTFCNVRFVNNDQELAKTVYQYAKAVAEAPYKRDRCNTGLSLFVDGSGSVAISKEGHGVQSLWRQQLQQFKNVTAEVANAIIADYRTPRDLFEAYKKCTTPKQAELLLQDIVIRRGVGVMATARRVGKELSRRLYQLMTSDDPDLLLS